jgi:hypothetical protein
MINKMMKKLMTDDLAEKFSWTGAHGKNPFKILMMPIVILRKYTNFNILHGEH